MGSCALLAVVQDNDLVVANSGDCIAVLGQVNPGYMESDNSHDGTSTLILAHQINREHNARNSLESLLLHQIHPNETDVVKCKHPHACYVKGRLQLTRAFGDLYLKSDEFNAPAGEHRSRYFDNSIFSMKRNVYSMKVVDLLFILCLQLLTQIIAEGVIFHHLTHHLM